MDSSARLPPPSGAERRQSALSGSQRVLAEPLNRYFRRLAGGDQRPVFFDIGRTCPQLDTVTAAYPAIRREIERVLALSTALPAYHELDPGQAKIAARTPRRWNVFLLEAFGRKPATNCRLCPETCAAIAAVPNVIQAFFSILEPGKIVPEHCGPFLGYLRYHLGLIVPARNPPEMVIKGIRHRWQEGRAALFDDSWPHAVQNLSDELRAVLIVDIRRPLPFLADVANRIATDVIGRYAYGRKVVRQAEAYAADAFGAQRLVAGV